MTNLLQGTFGLTRYYCNSILTDLLQDAFGLTRYCNRNVTNRLQGAFGLTSYYCNSNLTKDLGQFPIQSAQILTACG